MKLFIRAALSGSLLFMLLCAGAMLIGQSNPSQPELFKYLSTCDGQPCYLGVVPAKTSWDDAVAVIDNQPPLKVAYQVYTARHPRGFQGIINLFGAPQGAAVGELDLVMYPASIKIGYAIEQFGVPCGVIVTKDGNIGLYFPFVVISVLPDALNGDQVLQPTTLLHEIDLSDIYPSCADLPADHLEYVWRGFTHYPR